MIPYGRQSITEEDIQAVVDVLRSDFLTQGTTVPRFENAISQYSGSAYAVAASSGTASLHLACLALGLGPGDLMWTTPITFVASANCALYCGAKVDFVDINPQTYNLCVQALEKKLKQASQTDRLPKIVIPVHMGGLPCDMETIRKLSLQYGFSIIEDACHSIGGRYKNKPIGNCCYSDITVYSFHPVKNITTGEGGMAVTNSKDLAEKMRLLRSHGITRNPEKMTLEQDGPWSYQQIELGFNYRMTDIQAALGISQLKRLDEFVHRRHRIAEKYAEHFIDFPVQIQSQPEDCYSGMHLFIVRIKTDKTTKTYRQIFQEMWEAGICVNLHYIPVHCQPFYQDLGFKKGDYPQAENYYQEAMSLPMYPDLNDEQIDKIVNEFNRIIN